MYLYLKPLLGLWTDVTWKLPVSLMLGVLSQELAQVLNTHPKYVLMVAVLIVVDFLSGILRTLLTKGKFASKQLRSTGVKTLEYILFLAAVVAVSNTFPEVMGWADDTGFFYVAMTELTSIVENISEDNTPVARLWAEIRRRIANEDQQG